MAYLSVHEYDLDCSMLGQIDILNKAYFTRIAQMGIFISLYKGKIYEYKINYMRTAVPESNQEEENLTHYVNSQSLFC